jgi:hypothetical protein
MSRAKDRSMVYVVADDIDQAREDPVREWSAERRPAWVIDSGTPATDPAAVEASHRVARPMRDALYRDRLAAERAAIAAVIPHDPSEEIRTAEKDLRRIQRQRQDLAAGTGRYAGAPIGHALWELGQAEMNVARMKRDLDRTDASRRDRRRSRAELGDWQERQSASETASSGDSGSRGLPPRRRGGPPHRAPPGARRAAGQPSRLGRRAPGGGPAPRLPQH